MTNLSGVVGGTLSMDSSGEALNGSAPSVLDAAMANREFAALRARKADERTQKRLEQEAQARGAATLKTKKEPRARELVTRESILELLSDAELSRVCNAEFQLRPGEEYLQLTHLDRGVACAGLTGTAFSAVDRAQVLPKSVLEASTWAMILAELSAR